MGGAPITARGREKKGRDAVCECRGAVRDNNVSELKRCEFTAKRHHHLGLASCQRLISYKLFKVKKARRRGQNAECSYGGEWGVFIFRFVHLWCTLGEGNCNFPLT